MTTAPQSQPETVLDNLLMRQAVLLAAPFPPRRALRIMRLAINRCLRRMHADDREFLADGGPEYMP